MLRASEILGYEFTVISFGTGLILLTHAVTGPILTWLIWLVALVIVILSYVDHACIGWGSFLTPGIQLQRILTDLLIMFVCGLILYMTSSLLMENVNYHDLSSILKAIQHMLRVHQYFGWFLYTTIFYLFFSTILGFLRACVNAAYLVVVSIIGIGASPPPPPPPPPRQNNDPILNAGMTT